MTKTRTRKQEPKVSCPWGCGYVGEPERAYHTNCHQCAVDPRHAQLNPWKCPNCGELGGGVDWGLW